MDESALDTGFELVGKDAGARSEVALLERPHNLGVLPGDGSLIGSSSLTSTGTSGTWGRISGGLFAEL